MERPEQDVSLRQALGFVRQLGGIEATSQDTEGFLFWRPVNRSMVDFLYGAMPEGPVNVCGWNSPSVVFESRDNRHELSNLLSYLRGAVATLQAELDKHGKPES